MSALRFGKQRGRVVVVADLGSGSVGVAILRVASGSPAEILHAERSALPAGERAKDATTVAILGLLSEVAQRAFSAYGKKARGGHIATAYAVIHSPWTRSKTIRVERQFSEQLKINKASLTAIARDALQTDNEYDHGKIIEAGIIRLELNGYPTQKPVGKYAHSLAASTLLSECDPAIRDGVTQTLMRIFACRSSTLRSDTRALISIIRESSALPKESLIVNMTDEATNTIVVRKGIVAETALVPEGSSSIVRKIAGERMPEETLALIRLVGLDRCEVDACEAIRAAIAKTEPELVKTFGDMFSRLSVSRRLPSRMILLSHKDLLSWLVQFFGRIDFAPFTVTTRPFSPEPLSIEALKELVAFETDNFPDISLGISAALVNMEEIVS